MNKTFKRHLISGAITFLTGFAIVLLANIDTLTLQNLQEGAWVGVGFTAIRAGIKGVLELFISIVTKE